MYRMNELRTIGRNQEIDQSEGDRPELLHAELASTDGEEAVVDHG